MLDFTNNTYIKLLNALLSLGYSFQTFNEFFKSPESEFIILRHDVDRLSNNTLKLAQIENSIGLNSTYFFRMKNKGIDTYHEKIIKKIANMGHEIGYHYEDLTITKGNLDKAYYSFYQNLKRLRTIYPIVTICMHGSPLSKYDSRKIWQKYDYRKLGIIGEPYFDVDYSQVLYLTDTGRRWDGNKFNLRDKVSKRSIVINDKLFNKIADFQNQFQFRSTFEIIRSAELGILPNKIILNVHPQRWFNPGIDWAIELISQNFKNYVKYLIIKLGNK
jgi:hypothetical protein